MDSFRYMATCVPGAEDIAAQEARDVILNIRHIQQARGKVFFDHAEPDWNRLRCIDNLYQVLHTFSIGSHKCDLSILKDQVQKIDFGQDAIALPKVIVSASRSGKHTYSRFDIAHAVFDALLDTGKFGAGDYVHHDLAVRVDVTDDACILSKKITPSQFRFRGDHYISSKGGIRPSIAHCLVRISQPQGYDTFYDPFCGAGTIPFERSYYPHKKIFASDKDEDIVDMAKSNLKQLAIAFAADAANTPMKACSIDTVVTNMPWGKQIKVNSGLYHHFFLELRRIVKPTGKAVILTDQDKLVQAACQDMGFHAAVAAHLSLHGLHPSVYIISF